MVFERILGALIVISSWNGGIQWVTWYLKKLSNIWKEFIAILYGESEKSSCCIVEKIREEIAKHSMEAYTERHTVLTVSIGVAVYQGDTTGIDEVMHRADKAMYLVKEEKNKVCT